MYHAHGDDASRIGISHGSVHMYHAHGDDASRIGISHGWMIYKDINPIPGKYLPEKLCPRIDSQN